MGVEKVLIGKFYGFAELVLMLIARMARKETVCCRHERRIPRQGRVWRGWVLLI